MHLKILLYIVLVLALLGITIQDIKKRQVHSLLLALIFVIALGINYLDDNLTLNVVLTNLGFVFINITGLFLYYSIKNRQLLNPIDKKIGLGDIIFFVAITPLFYLKSYILFFIIGLICSLVVHLIVNRKKSHVTVPLAGYLSVCLIVFIGVDLLFNVKIMPI